MLMASNPSIDILELPIIRDAQKEKFENKFKPSSTPITRNYSTASATTTTTSSPPSPLLRSLSASWHLPRTPPPPPRLNPRACEHRNRSQLLQLNEVLRRFLLRHSEADIKARQNLSSCVFAPGHAFHKIKAIWSKAIGGFGGERTGMGAVLPSNDIVLTEHDRSQDHVEAFRCS